MDPELQTPVPSPCINICKMVPETGLCQGCMRTIDEIRAWRNASEDEKRDKEVIVRPTSNGHDDCHAAKGPLKDVDRNKSSMYSWKDMWDMNDRAEVSPVASVRACG